MFKIVYELPNDKSFAFVSRSCSSSLGLMAIKQFYPEKVTEYNANPSNLNTGHAHRLLGGKLVQNLPDGCAIMIRNPIERFASLLNRTGYSIESALELIYWVYNIGDAPENNNRSIERSSLDAAYHFMPYSLMINQQSKLFKFPDINSIAKYLKIENNYEHINKSSNKPNFNEIELIKIKKAYCEDIKIWNSFSNT